MDLDVLCSAKAIWTLRYVADHPDLTRSEIFGQKNEKDLTVMRRLEDLIGAGLVEAYPGGKVKGREVMRHKVTKKGEQVLLHLKLLEEL